jgi:hypothetical protein
MAKKAKWIAIALLIANEIRGILVVAAVGPPIIRAMFG